MPKRRRRIDFESPAVAKYQLPAHLKFPKSVMLLLFWPHQGVLRLLIPFDLKKQDIKYSFKTLFFWFIKETNFQYFAAASDLKFASQLLGHIAWALDKKCHLFMLRSFLFYLIYFAYKTHFFNTLSSSTLQKSIEWGTFENGSQWPLKMLLRTYFRLDEVSFNSKYVSL